MIYRHSRADVRQEEDRVPRTGILAGLAATMIIAVALSAWATAETNAHTRAIRPNGLRTEQSLVLGHSISGVMLDLFTTKGEGEALNVAKQGDLTRLEWLDRRRNLARIPIDEAMKAIVEENAR